MKKRFGIYATFWAILVALFNVIAFVSPGWIGFEKYDSAFWIGYVFISAAFFGQLACAWFALKEENAAKLFYKLSLFSISYTSLIITFIVGGLCMLISLLPYWIGILACSIVMAANVLAVIKAAAAIDEVQRIDSRVKEQTRFIKSLTVDAELLLSRATTEEKKTLCKKVYEAVRYSDPMSCEELLEIEEKIKSLFVEFSKTLSSEIAEELLALMTERNKRCKLLK